MPSDRSVAAARTSPAIALCPSKHLAASAQAGSATLEIRLYVSTAHGAMSLAHTGRMPARANPRSRPPHPE